MQVIYNNLIVPMMGRVKKFDAANRPTNGTQKLGDLWKKLPKKYFLFVDFVLV